MRVIRYLLDTHVLLWWAESPDQLSKEARLTIASGRNQLFFSYASVWELAIKQSLGTITLPDTTGVLIHRTRCTTLPVSLKHIAVMAELPHLHEDPFDRMLIAQAKAERLTLITRNRNIEKYDVPTMAA